MDIIYFSPTGNVKHLAQYLADVLLEGETTATIHPLEHTEPQSLAKGGSMVLMYPVHAFNPPRTVLRFVRSLPSAFNRDVTIISVGSSSSWMNAAASWAIQKILKAKGCKICQVELLAMPLTIVAAFSDEQAKEVIAKSEERIQLVATRLLTGHVSDINIPLKSKIISKIGQLEGFAARLFGRELRANEDCTSCGLCARECPEGNIRMNNANHPVFGMRCLMCMRCIYNCPERAISPRLSKFIPIKGGYDIERYQDG